MKNRLALFFIHPCKNLFQNLPAQGENRCFLLLCHLASFHRHKS